ncbi:MAG: acyl-CoA dehydrogenase family protein [Deltaproteobacteria bacterium]|nr:acyl-CoA dehydrogenase family protein [Deltaproteobacteria bacterium]
MSARLELEELIGWQSLLNEDEKTIQRNVKRFVRSRCMPRIVDDFENHRVPKELIGELADLGLLGANLEGYGCAGISSVGYGLACQELEACDSGLRSFISVQTSLAMYAIHAFGSEEQKNDYLPRMAAGKCIGCFGLTEPNAGSNPGQRTTRAVKDGDHWVLSGEKMWITNAQIADVAVVWAQTSSESKDVTGFILDKGMAGFKATDIPHKLSLRASYTGGLSMMDVRVPDKNRLPNVKGMRGPLSCLTSARYGVAFGVLGAARACLETSVEYARERKQLGGPIARKQLVQVKLADMANEITKGSLMAVHFGRLKDEGKLLPAQVSLLKRNNCKIALDAARMSRNILGANGITGEHHVMRHAMNLESTFTYEGTDDVHALVIGEALTGERAY